MARDIGNPPARAARRTAEGLVPDDWAGLAKAVREARKERGITQKQLQAASGVSISTIKEIERGKKRAFGRGMLESLSAPLGYPQDHLAKFLYTLSPPVNASTLEQAIKAAFGPRLEKIDRIDLAVDLLHGLADAVRDLSAQVGELGEQVAALSGERPVSYQPGHARRAPTAPAPLSGGQAQRPAASD